MSNIRETAGRILFYFFLFTLVTPWLGSPADAATGDSLVPPSNYEDPEEDAPDPDPYEDPEEDAPDPDPLVSEVVSLVFSEPSSLELYLVGEALASLIEASGATVTVLEGGERLTLVLPRGQYEVQVEAWGRYRLHYDIVPVRGR